MEYEAECCTDRGMKKEVNQDSACVMIADTAQGQVCMALLCDGMGGISMGECASFTVMDRFVEWFENKLPYRVGENVGLEAIGEEWQTMLAELDACMREYGNARQMKLGTTVTGMLFWKRRYLLVQSGDSRAYCLDKRIAQISEDQSFVQKQIDSGLMTEEEARCHPRRNVLTDCIGGSRPSISVCSYGRLHGDAHYLLCSDGFVHELRKEEILEYLGPGGKIPGQVGDNMSLLIKEVMSRGETDNITAVVVMATKAASGFFKPKLPANAFAIRKKMIVTEGSRLEIGKQPTTETEE